MPDGNVPFVRHDTTSDSWCDFILQLRACNVLTDTNPNQFPDDEGCLLIVCPDGHRFRNKWAFHLECFGDRPCHHPQLPLGGTLIFGDGSPLAQTESGHNRAAVFMDDIGTSLRLKGLRTIAAYMHYPCSAAREAGLTPARQMGLFVSGIRNLSLKFPNTHIVPFCHVHYPEDRYRTYSVNIASYT